MDPNLLKYDVHFGLKGWFWDPNKVQYALKDCWLEMVKWHFDAPKLYLRLHKYTMCSMYTSIC